VLGAEAALDACHVREDQEHGRLDVASEDRGRGVLVHHALDADQARAVLDHRDAAAPRRDHDDALGDEASDHGRLDDRVRRRRGDHPPEPAVGVGLEGPPLLLGEHLRLLLLVEGPDRLRRVAEGRVVGRHARERQDRRHGPLHPPLEEHVADRHLEQVADLPLAQRPAHVERHRVHPLPSRLLLEEDPAHLRAVAVGDDDLPPRRRDVGDPLGGQAGRAVHVLERVLLAATEQRVAAERDDDSVHG
jgi:hypothetical protein